MSLQRATKLDKPEDEIANEILVEHRKLDAAMRSLSSSFYECKMAKKRNSFAFCRVMVRMTRVRDLLVKQMERCESLMQRMGPIEPLNGIVKCIEARLHKIRVMQDVYQNIQMNIHKPMRNRW